MGLPKPRTVGPTLGAIAASEGGGLVDSEASPLGDGNPSRSPAARASTTCVPSCRRECKRLRALWAPVERPIHHAHNTQSRFHVGGQREMRHRTTGQATYGWGLHCGRACSTPGVGLERSAFPPAGCSRATRSRLSNSGRNSSMIDAEADDRSWLAAAPHRVTAGTPNLEPLIQHGDTGVPARAQDRSRVARLRVRA